MNYSKYQLDFFDVVKKGDSNIVLNATAGSGKSSSIKRAIELLPKSSILAVAFNKSIAQAFQEKLPAYVESSTIHSIGAKILRENRINAKVDSNKMISIASKLSRSWHKDKFLALDADKDKDVENAFFAYKMRIIELANMSKFNLCETLDDFRYVAKKLGIDVMDKEVERAYELREVSLNDEKTIDFNDMVYLPVVKKLRPSKLYDYVFVDEAQDTSAMSQALIQNVVNRRKGHIYWVGDPKQSIYAFAGADSEAFKKLKEYPNTISLPLSITYRCPKQIVEYARKYTPELEWAEGNDKGEINMDAELSDVQDSDMVLCRNTAPLVKIYLKFLKQDRKSYIQGNDILGTLNKIIDGAKIKTCDHLIAYMFTVLKGISKEKQDKFGLTEKQSRKTKSYLDYKEKCTIVKEIVIHFNLRDTYSLKKKLFSIFNSNTKSGIHLSTIHKAKGLENKRVFIYAPELIPQKFCTEPWEFEQEDNLMYVAITRSAGYLGFIKGEEDEK